MNEYLQPAKFVDSDHPEVIDFARQHAVGADDREKAVALYRAVRDGVRYNPFQNFTLDDAYRGSTCLERGEGWCVPKAALLAGCARAVGIPARVGYADVKNHLTTPALTAKMGTDLFVFHGYTVETVSDGEAALALLVDEQQRYDALVLDVMLPGKDGFAVASELRAAGHRGRAFRLRPGFRGRQLRPLCRAPGDPPPRRAHAWSARHGHSA